MTPYICDFILIYLLVRNHIFYHNFIAVNFHLLNSILSLTQIIMTGSTVIDTGKFIFLFSCWRNLSLNLTFHTVLTVFLSWIFIWIQTIESSLRENSECVKSFIASLVCLMHLQLFCFFDRKKWS